MRFKTLILTLVSTAFLCGDASAQYEEGWVNTYHVPGGTSDEPVAIATDDSGFVYIAGTTLHPTRAEDMLLLKYTAAGGLVGAVATSGAADSTDIARAIAVDDSGQAYVVGHTYAGPTTGWDYFLVKHDANADQLWTRTFDAGFDNTDYGKDVAITPSGTIVVLGLSWDGTVMSSGLVEYTPGGVVQWSTTFHWPTTQADNPRRLACDASGNLYVCASSLVSLNNNILTVKFDPDGDTLWARQYDGAAGGFDDAVAIQVASDGSVYVAGQSEGVGTFADMILLKYNEQGSLLWERRHNGTADSADFAYDLVLDPDGNPIVSGVWMDDGTYFDGVVFKYLADGTLDWLNTGYAFGWEYDDFAAVAVDVSGNAFATGTSLNIARPSNDVFTAFFDAETGSRDWERYYAVDSGGDYGTDLCIDPTENIYVTARTYSGVPTGWDIATIKYSPVASGIKDVGQGEIPHQFTLHQNYPNPFNAETSIRFDLARGGSVELAIFNALGQRVFAYSERGMLAGSYVLSWDGRDTRGQEAASGIYLYRLQVGDLVMSKKMTLLR